MSDPFIIISAPNGARRQKHDHPALPLVPEELAACAEEIVAAGAGILHLHVRDENNQHTLDTDRYRAAISKIRAAVGDQIIIQATSEAVGRYSSAQQMQMVRELRPEAVSLALRELCPQEQDITIAARFFSWLRSERIFAQYILYDRDDLIWFETLRKQGVFAEEQPFVLLVIGRAPLPASKSLLNVHSDGPWAKCGFGFSEFAVVCDAVENNGHARVGFENNIHRKDGSLLADHSAMISFCKEQAKGAGRKIANADMIRKLFSLE